MDTPNNNENKNGDGSKAVDSVDHSTLDDVLVRDNSKYDSMEDCSSKDSSSKESSKDSSSKKSGKDNSSKKSSKDSSSKESSKASSSQESSKGSSTKSSKKDSGKSSSDKGTEGSSTKDDNENLHLVMEEDSQDQSIEQDSIGESIEEIAEEVADEFEEEEGGEAEADWPAEPQDINSPDSPGEESPIHGPPAMELIVHEAASEGIMAPEDVVVFEPEVSVAVQVVHVVSVPVPVEELQPAPIVAQEHSSANSAVSVREQPQASNVAQQSSANTSVSVREQPQASNVTQPSSANTPVSVREQPQASNVAQQPSSANTSVSVQEQLMASNVAQQTQTLNASVNQNGAEQSPAVRLPEQQTTNPQPEFPFSLHQSSFDCLSSALWLSEAQWIPVEESQEEGYLPLLDTLHPGFPQQRPCSASRGGGQARNCSNVLFNLPTLAPQPRREPRPVQLDGFSAMQHLWDEMDLPNPIGATGPSAIYYFAPPVEQSSSPSREQTSRPRRAVPAPELDFTIALTASAICGAIGIALMALARHFNRR